MILAYCRDKFDDPISAVALESLQHKNLLSMDTLIEAKEHDRTNDYVFSAEQLVEIKKDPKLRLFLTYTYDKELKTTFNRLTNYFKVQRSEVETIVKALKSMRLVEVVGEEIKKIHAHSSIPCTPDLFNLRRDLLLQGLELSLNHDSYISNYLVDVTEESYKRILSLMDFIGASLVRVARGDEKKEIRFEFRSL